MEKIVTQRSRWTKPQFARLGALHDVSLNILPGSKQNPGGNACTGKGSCVS